MASQNPNGKSIQIDGHKSTNVKKRRFYGAWYDFTKMRSENRGSVFWILAEKLASEIVHTHKDKLDNPCVAAVRLNHLGVEPVAGVLFSMDFEVEGVDGKTSPYFAEVWVKPSPTKKPVVQLFQKVIYSGRSKKGKKVTLYTNKKPPVLKPSLFSDLDKRSRELVCGKNNCRLRTRGFYILLSAIRRECPWMKFAAVRRSTKSLWRQLPEDEKVRYMEAAASRLKRKRSSQTLSDA